MAKNDPIILIDDDKDECEILEDAFRRESITNGLLCFSNGEDALHYLETTNERTFLILCDVNMPVMSGIELARRIHENEYLRRKSIPFVFYTTSATEHAVKEAYEMSVQGFFEKRHDAVSIADLVRRIYDYWQWCRHPNE